MDRVCPVDGKPLVRRYDESHTRFARRVYCGRACANTRIAVAAQYRRRAERIEDLEWIAGTDSTENVARRLGYRSAASLIRTVARWDCPELLLKLQRHCASEWSAA